nr:hypothetical protein [Lactobacillus gasseri]
RRRGLIFLYSFDEFIQAAKQAGLPFIRAHNNAASRLPGCVLTRVLFNNFSRRESEIGWRESVLASWQSSAVELFVCS